MMYCKLRRATTALLIAGMLLLLGAAVGCGGQGSQALLPPAPDAGQPALQPEAQPAGLIGLPRLDQLGQAPRSLSATGYGLQPLLPSGFLKQQLCSANPDDSLAMNPALTSGAFAIYGLAGFRDGAYPVSAKLEFSGPVTDCFVAFPDYSAGRWRFEGPFTGSVEVPIVLRGQPQGYNSFINSKGSSFFAVLFPAGNSGGTLSAVSFGVNGGSSGPASPRLIEAKGGDKGIILRWDPSQDADGADFAGYLVERAPQFEGDFVLQTSEPTPWNDHFDPSAELGKHYRYRLWALDLSGNRSAPVVTVIGMVAGQLLDPVARISYSPRGPYLAPTLVKYDMSESYDPEGEGISAWELRSAVSIQSWGNTVSGSFTLGAGAYPAQARVTAGARFGTAIQWLKALPQWESSSRVVRPSDPSTAIFLRLTMASPFLLPGDPTPWAVGYDIAANGVAFMRDSGGVIEHHRAGLTNLAIQLSRPVVIGNACWVLASDLNRKMTLIRFNGQQAQIVSIMDGGDYEPTVALAATAGDEARGFYSWSADGTFYMLRTALSSEEGGGVAILPNGLSSNPVLRAVYNPTADRYDIFFVSSTFQTRWLRWNAATNSVEQNQLLSGAEALEISPAVNPVNGRTSVACLLGSNWVWSEYDGAAWSMAETVSSNPTNAVGQLAFQDGKAYLLNMDSTGQVVLRERTGPASWIERNKPLSASNGGTSCGLWPGINPGELLALDGVYFGGLNQTRLWKLDAAGTDETLLSLLGINAPALEYAAVGGIDGLHLLTRPNFIGNIEHWRSPDGQSWTGADSGLPLVHPRLACDGIGLVYVGGFHTGSSDGRLFFWNYLTESFEQQMTSIPVSESSSIALSGKLVSNEMTFTGYDSAGPWLQRSTGNAGGGPGGTWVTSNEAVTGPLWRGCVGISGWYGSSGGSSEREAAVYRINNPNETKLFKFVVEDDFAYLSQLMLNNFSYRQAQAYVRGTSIIGPISSKEYFGSTFGALTDPQRCEVDLLTGAVAQEELEFQNISLVDFPSQDYRRTLSLVSNFSANAISLLCTLDGSVRRFEWTGVDGWEPLEMPAGIERMMAPQVVAGYDGRWHIVYYDWVTDELLIRSTL